MGASEYPDVELDHALVDSFAMTIVQAPETIDTVVTENTFGDILSDIAAAVTGGLGLAASASLGDDGPGIFEPVHGSAPQIAGPGDREPGGDAALGRADARPTASAVPTRRPRSSGPSTSPSLEAPTPDLGGTEHDDRGRRRRLARPRRCPYPVTTMRRAPATTLLARAPFGFAFMG